MSSMGELTFFLGLQVKQKEDGIFISQDKYVGEILKKFGFSRIRTASTPMETNKALTKEEDGKDVDIHLCRSMIGPLIYLTSSRPYIMFSVCACSRFQVQPKVSHLNAVKRIFRYLKGRPKLGLWYPKDSPFILEAFLDSDYEDAILDRKSTTGGCKFLGSRLIPWQCKKQTVVANSTTEAEYIAASHCCGQLIESLFEEKLYGTMCINAVDYTTWILRMECLELQAYLEKSDENAEFHQIVDFLSTCSINYALTLKDLPEPFNDTYVMPCHTKKFFSNKARKRYNFSGNITPLFASMLVQNQAPEGEGSAIHPKTQPTPSTSQPNVSEPQIASLHIETSPIAAPQTEAHQTATQKLRRTRKDTKLPQTSVPLDHGADEVLDLEKEKDSQVVEILNLMKRVKKLERKRKLSISHPRRRKYRQVETSFDAGLDEEDASKQGRRSDKLKPMFKDKDFEELDDHMENVEEETVDADATGVSTVSAPVSTTGVTINTVEPRTPPTTTTVFNDEDVTMAMAQTLIKMKEQKAKEKGVAIIDVEDSSRIVRPVKSITTLQPLPNLDPKDKGKGVLVEEEPKNIKIRDQGQEDDTNAALANEFDEIQARIDADHELAVRLTHEKQEKYTIEERARLLVEFFDQRKKQLAAARAEAISNNPPTKTQVRNMMITYLKYMGKYTHQQLKNKTYEEIQRLYEKEKRWIDDFQPMDTKAIKDSEKKVDNSSNPARGSRKKTLAIKRAGKKKSKESAKKQKLEDVAEEQESGKSDEEAAADYEHEKEELRMWLIVVSDEEGTVDPKILSAKYPIVDWESQNLGSVDMEDLHILSCGVHTLLMDRTLTSFNMLVEKRYPLIKEMLQKMLNWKPEAEAESTMAFELLKFIKS
ncbi:hypothetical protein Tco_1563926 [Tanacetum coccineum]